MTIPRVVACDVLGDESVIYLQKEDGSIASIRRRFRPYLLTPNDGNPLSLTLKGKNYYNSLTFFENKAKFWESYRKACDKFAIHDDRQALFTIGKLNLFHDTRFDEISVLGFDCETSGLRLDDKAELFLITNTFRKAQVTSKKTFFYKDFTDQGHMLRAWVDWVREMDPTIILGFNCLKFDFPYILHIANKFGVQLNLGRDGSQLKTEFPKQFRTDGNHSIEYEDVSIHGRHVIDLWLLAMKFDTGRRFENYQLKYLVKTLGLMDENRALYDASIISENIHIDSELKKIIAYAEDDASDLIKLWDRMGEPFFELAKAVPKSLQSVVYSGIGSIWNSMMVREYLNMGHSIPKATEITASYEGGLSIGNAGLYHHLLRFDVASLYPSIILLYGIYEETKDPHRKFLTLIEEFTSKRLRQKALDQETGKAQHQWCVRCACCYGKRI
jgi:DNA polymerase elongation subunit (family B)